MESDAQLLSGVGIFVENIPQVGSLPSGGARMMDMHSIINYISNLLIQRIVILSNVPVRLSSTSSSLLFPFGTSNAFQNFKFSSEAQDATVSPSGDNAVLMTRDSCPGKSAIFVSFGYDQIVS